MIIPAVFSVFPSLTVLAAALESSFGDTPKNTYDGDRTMIVWMKVTDDRYELPELIADSAIVQFNISVQASSKTA